MLRIAIIAYSVFVAITAKIIDTGPPRELEGPREKYLVTALIEYLTSIRVYRSFGAHEQSGA